MVLTRATTATTPELPLPYDMAVEIAGHVAASSPRPLDDISNLRASCRVMRAACREGAVGRRVALEREVGMKWVDAARYRAIVERLVGAGNPEACFLAGLARVFVAADDDRCAGSRGTESRLCLLARAAAAGHRAAAYVLALLRYDADCRDRDAVKYIRQVEGEHGVDSDTDTDESAMPEYVIVTRKKKRRITNTECERCRAQAMEAIREVTWNVLPSPAATTHAVLPKEEAHRCTVAGCGTPKPWSNCLLFCSDDCRIRHEHAQFFSMVSLPPSIS